jgi:hypothetical protein
VKKIFTLCFLRIITLIGVLFGAFGSLGLMFNAGRHTPVFLLILFVGLVVLPYIGLLIVNKISKNWSVPIRVTLYCLMLVITLASLVAYSGALTSPETKPAAIFLIVPLISWLLIAIFILVAKYLSKRNST